MNRATLRQILLTGLGGIVRFGKRLSHYENGARDVAVTFEDGTRAEGDLLWGPTASGRPSGDNERPMRTPKTRV